MKITILTAIACAFTIFGFSQEEEINRTGNFIIDPAIGVPNAGSFLLMSGNVFDSYNSNEETKNTSMPVQFGGRLEYMLTNKIGLGFEGNYEKTGFERTVADAVYDPSTGYYKDTTYSWSQAKTRYLLRFHYHPVQTKRVDFYMGAGLGMSTTKIVNPENEMDEFDSFFFPILLFDRATNPLAARIFIGTRIMFSNNFGFLIEGGLGSGSILDFGLSARF